MVLSPSYFGIEGSELLKFEFLQCLEELGSASPIENSPELISEADSF